MLFFHAIHMEAWLGAIVATIIGYSSSILLALRQLKKHHDLSYRSMKRLCYKLIVPLTSMVLVVILLKQVIPVNYMSKVSCIFYVGIISVVGAFVYLFITYQFRILQKVFGKSYVQKIIKKLTFGKVSF